MGQWMWGDGVCGKGFDNWTWSVWEGEMAVGCVGGRLLGVRAAMRVCCAEGAMAVVGVGVRIEHFVRQTKKLKW